MLTNYSYFQMFFNTRPKNYFEFWLGLLKPCYIDVSWDSSIN